MYFLNANAGWFKVDNMKHNFLHFHLESGAQSFKERILLPENLSISGLISYTFEKAEKTAKWKFPDFKISCGSDFLGVA